MCRIFFLTEVHVFSELQGTMSNQVDKYALTLRQIIMKFLRNQDKMKVPQTP